MRVETTYGWRIQQKLLKRFQIGQCSVLDFHSTLFRGGLFTSTVTLCFFFISNAKQKEKSSYYGNLECTQGFMQLLKFTWLFRGPEAPKELGFLQRCYSPLAHRLKSFQKVDSLFLPFKIEKQKKTNIDKLKENDEINLPWSKRLQTQLLRVIGARKFFFSHFAFLLIFFFAILKIQ